MTTFEGLTRSRVLQSVLALAALGSLLVESSAAAATIIATPGEQNTQSGENGCAATPCQGGHWLHYPELLQVALGAGYTVMNNGDGGAVLGCDDASAAVAGNNSFCKSGKYTASIAGPPNVAIIGPFGEHDQRVIAGNNEAMYGNQASFEGAYEGLVQKYLTLNAKVYVMTPVDVPWGGTANLTSGKNIVKDFMLPAALKIAQNHNLKVIDTYTAISGTPQLITMYYGSDGQVTMAGQQKMADLVLAALNDNGSGGSGGAGGAAAGGAAGTGGAGGVSGGAGGAGGGAAGSVAGGAAGTFGVAGTAATSAGSAGAPGGAGSGASGSAALAGAAGTHTQYLDSDSSSCALSGVGSTGWGTGVALAGIAFGLLKRRRK